MESRPTCPEEPLWKMAETVSRPSPRKCLDSIERWALSGPLTVKVPLFPAGAASRAGEVGSDSEVQLMCNPASSNSFGSSSLRRCFMGIDSGASFQRDGFRSLIREVAVGSGTVATASQKADDLPIRVLPPVRQVGTPRTEALPPLPWHPQEDLFPYRP